MVKWLGHITQEKKLKKEMEGLLVFSGILFVMMLFVGKFMRKTYDKDSDCPQGEIAVKNNVKWHTIFTIISIIGMIVGFIGTFVF